MATKNKGKGNVLQCEISSVYTAIPQIISIDKSGEASETFPARTLDGNKHSDMLNTGYVSNPEIGFECFWDSANTVHAFLKTSMRTPPTAGVNFKHIDVSGTPVTEIWLVYGIGIDEKITTDDGCKANVKLQTSGDPT
jgi:hypothetical protein